MLAASLAAVLIALAIPATVARFQSALLVLACLYGGLAFPLYSLSVAHANDYIEAEDLVQASSGLLLSYGVGATLGPIAAAAVMGALGPSGLFVFSAAVTAPAMPGNPVSPAVSENGSRLCSSRPASV